MMFVREGFDERLVRAFCMSQRPHSCGPGAWSLPADRGSWDAQTKAWAAQVGAGWPEQVAAAPKRGGRRKKGLT